MSLSLDLQRFVDAQENVYADVVRELGAGRKRSHWMWFIFPQIAGLGHSEMARHYAIASREEAAAFLDHPVLGPRLRECTQLVLDGPNRSIAEIFGHPDDLKFHSSMTLFSASTSDNELFQAALERYFGGLPDSRTLELMATLSRGS